MSSVEVVKRVVMFTDVHNYSIVVAEIGQERSYSFVQRMYEAVGDEIVARGGEILKYIGDAILAIFPETAAREAASAGIEMRKAYQRLVTESTVETETELELGISAGEIGIRTFGHASHAQRDAINEAAMIGHHRGIAVVEPVREEISGEFRLRPLPDAHFKWRDMPVKIWEIEEPRSPLN